MLQEIGNHSFHNEFRQPLPQNTDLVAVFSGKSIFLTKDGGFPTAAAVRALCGAELVYLFAVDETAIFLLDDADARVCSALEARPAAAAVRTLTPDHLRLAGYTALHLREWYRASRFCGRCGAPARRDDKERAMRCTACGAIVYPRINPAVVVALRDGDRMLVTRYADRPMASRYALVAGFVEIGETMAQTVAREVMEEVGLRVKNVRYYADQPWGVAGNQMVGFWADLDGDGTVTVDHSELSEAVWLRREEIPESENPIALTQTLLNLFHRGEDPR